MDYYEILKKYKIYDEAIAEFKSQTAKCGGAMNIKLRDMIYVKHIDKKVRELRDKRSDLVKCKGACTDFERISNEKSFLHSKCSFINSYPQKICESCNFYKENIKSIDESIKELEEASKYIEDEADHLETWI